MPNAMCTNTETTPLSTLLSFAWTAFTMQIDNAFEARMRHSTTKGHSRGKGPWLVSHAMWWTCMRFVDAQGLRVGELEALARTCTNLSGMIRWGYVVIEPKAEGGDPRRGNPLVRATRNGLAAREVWSPLPREVEDCWRSRMGELALLELRTALATIVASLAPGSPDCMPVLGYGLTTPPPIVPPSPPSPDAEEDLPLVVMLARVLLALTLEYEQVAGLSLAIGASVLRLVEADGALISDLPGLSGVSKEAIAMASGFLQKRGMASLTSDGRRRTLKLTPAGLKAKATYKAMTGEIEKRWRVRFGAEKIQRLRDALAPIVTGEGLDALSADLASSSKGGWRDGKVPATLPWQPMVLHRGGYPDGA